MQTYALSLGVGFVGAAGSVSVWSVGTQPNTTYNDGAGGQQPPKPYSSDFWQNSDWLAVKKWCTPSGLRT